MARRKRTADPPTLREDPLVASLVTDPGDVPPLEVLAGLLGEASRPGSLRLYLKATLDEYFEIATDDVVHRETVPQAGSALGGTVLWIRRGAETNHVRTQPARLHADFLSGPLAEAALKSTGMAGANATPVTIYTTQWTGPSLICTWICTVPWGQCTKYCIGTWWRNCELWCTQNCE